MPAPDEHPAIADTRRWLVRAVIGLNLCPFAKAVHAKGQVHATVVAHTAFADVLEALDGEARALVAADERERDTTLLVLPEGFGEFLLFQDLVRAGEKRLARLGLEGVLQLAHFHPHFVFAGVADDDPGNCSNRSPHPTLHLLRESSVDRAVAAFPQAESIYDANLRTLRGLGWAGWRDLDVGAR